MSKTTDKVCAECVHFDNKGAFAKIPGQESYGYCRRNSPKISDRAGSVPVRWPVVQGDEDYCGDFEWKDD